MSSRVGTLQAPKIGGSIWPAAFVAAFVVLTMAIVAVSIGRNEVASQAPAAGAVVETTTEFSGTVANTPTELSGGIVGGGQQASASTVGKSSETVGPASTYTPAASTVAGALPSTGSPYAGYFAPVQRPVELTPAERYDLHQRI